MTICIAYDTYSSSTESVVEIVGSKLKEKGCEVKIIRMRDIKSPDELHKFDLRIVATPSWFEQSKEGQPHISFLNFMDQAKDASFKDMSFAFIGLGDSSYAHFCHGIDILSKFIEDHEGKNVAPILKLDSFFFNKEAQIAQIEPWIQQLPLK